VYIRFAESLPPIYQKSPPLLSYSTPLLFLYFTRVTCIYA
jgi:hypothetical protein